MVCKLHLNNNKSKYNIEKLIEDNLNINLDVYENLKQEETNENEQLDFFSMSTVKNVEENKSKFKYVYGVFAYSIFKLYEKHLIC